MTWAVELPEVMRVIIDDMGEPPLFTDSKLIRVLTVAAFQVLQECNFTNTYSVSISAQSISPDPCDTDSREDSFSNLICLKAACIISHGEARTAARKGFAVREGSTSADLRGVADARIKLLEKGLCKVYEEAKLEYELGQVRVAGAAVMTPFRVWAQPDCY